MPSHRLKAKPWPIETLKILNQKPNMANNEPSVWDQYKRENEGEGGFFLRNTNFDDTPTIVKFLDIEWRQQNDKTPDVFKTTDGRELLLSFEINGEKRGYTAKSHSNALVIAMKQSNIEPGDSFECTRTGEGIDTRFKCNKIREDGTVVVKDEIPF